MSLTEPWFPCKDADDREVFFTYPVQEGTLASAASALVLGAEGLGLTFGIF